jgi:hypothetical protein
VLARYGNRPDPDRLAALASAIALNAAFFWFLRTLVISPSAPPGAAQNALEVVWIKRPLPPPSVISPKKFARPDTRQTPLRQPHAEAAPRTFAGTPTHTEAATAFAEGSPAPRPLNLSLPEPPISFVRSPLAHRRIPLPGSTSQLELPFRDRSAGGVLRRMAKAGVCSELRRALGNNSDTASILQSMQANGCSL